MRAPLSLLLVCTALGAGALMAPSGAEAAQPARGCDAVTVYSHRGDESRGDTENSLGSLAVALEQGDSIETDLRTTRDGKVILMHDPTIDRTTTGTGRVDALTGAQIRSHPMNDGSTVPYAANALRLLSHHPTLHAFLELKPQAMPPASQQRLRTRALELGVRDQVTVYSYDRVELASFKRIAPSFETSLIRWAPVADWAPRRFLAYGGASVRGADLSRRWIARAHALGLPLTGLDAETIAAWRANVKAGVHGQILDRTDAYHDWCGSAP